MEKWDLYTLDRVKTNHVITRGDDIPKNLYCKKPNVDSTKTNL